MSAATPKMGTRVYRVWLQPGTGRWQAQCIVMPTGYLAADYSAPKAEAAFRRARAWARDEERKAVIAAKPKPRRV